jgi:plasminogen activator inhibitor 1 RNA-binding protein
MVVSGGHDDVPFSFSAVYRVLSAVYLFIRFIFIADKGGRSARGGGRARGKGRGAGGDRAGKREFDRHDASGRGHETEKRHGGGRGNWGAEGDESKELAEKLTLGADGEEADGSDAEAAAPEEKQLSLEEYEALMEEKRAGLNVQREASFKVDKAQFQGMKTFEKQEEDVGLSLNKNSKSIGTNKAGRERERKERDVVVDVGFRVQSAEEAPARGGDRGGRGRGGDRRGGRGGGRSSGGRGGRTSSGGRGRGGNASINVGDTNAFPSL